MTPTAALEGVLPALITPFTADGSAIDPAGVRDLVDRTVGAGVSGLVPCGSTGEFTTLSGAERRRMVELTIEAAAGRVPTIPGTGAMSTAETIELSLHAERCGAAAVMVVPPYYEALQWEELLRHFTALAERLSIPIVLYNIPGATGTNLTIEQLCRLRSEAGVSSLKDTSGDAVTATELIQRGDGVPTLLNGWDTLTFGALAAGVRTVIWGSASFMPEQCVELHRLLIERLDLAQARGLWSRMWPVCRFLEQHSYSASVKAACSLVGLSTGPVRPPLIDLDGDARAELSTLLAGAGASPAGAGASR